MKVRKLDEHRDAGRGYWREDGVFVFRTHSVAAPSPVKAAPPRCVSLADRISNLPSWPQGTGKGARSWGGLGAPFLQYPQQSRGNHGGDRSMVKKHPGFAKELPADW
jgi:hypothetical protein